MQNHENKDVKVKEERTETVEREHSGVRENASADKYDTGRQTNERTETTTEVTTETTVSDEE